MSKSKAAVKAGQISEAAKKLIANNAANKPGAKNTDKKKEPVSDTEFCLCNIPVAHEYDLLHPGQFITAVDVFLKVVANQKLTEEEAILLSKVRKAQI